MILSMNEQAMLFLMTVVAGACIGLLYDVLRIFRKIIPHNSFVMQLEDAAYWIVVVFMMFLMLLQSNNGEIRVFIIFGAFLGMGLYYLIASPLVNGISDRVVFLIKYVVVLFFTIILTPFRLIYILFRSPVRKMKLTLNKKSKKVLHSGKIYVKIKRRAVVRNGRILLRKRCNK